MNVTRPVTRPETPFVTRLEDASRLVRARADHHQHHHQQTYSLLVPKIQTAELIESVVDVSRTLRP